MDTVEYYQRVYADLFMQYWNALTPTQYGVILITISVIGYLLMKSGARM